MTKKMGRPATADPRDNITPVRLSEAEKKTLQESADIAGIPMGRLIREDALAAADKRIKASAKAR